MALTSSRAVRSDSTCARWLALSKTSMRSSTYLGGNATGLLLRKHCFELIHHVVRVHRGHHVGGALVAQHWREVQMQRGLQNIEQRGLIGPCLRLERVQLRLYDRF